MPHDLLQPDPDFERELATDRELREISRTLEQKLGVGGGMALAIVQTIWCKGRNHAIEQQAAEERAES